MENLGARNRRPELQPQLPRPGDSKEIALPPGTPVSSTANKRVGLERSLQLPSSSGFISFYNMPKKWNQIRHILKNRKSQMLILAAVSFVSLKKKKQNTQKFTQLFYLLSSLHES